MNKTEKNYYKYKAKNGIVGKQAMQFLILGFHQFCAFISQQRRWDPFFCTGFEEEEEEEEE